MNVRYRMIGALGMVAVALAGCTSGGGGGPASSPVPTPTPTGQVTSVPTAVSTSPSPARTGPLTTGPNVRPGEKPPVFPAAARRRDASGALFFASYYYAAINWSFSTNDSYLLRQLSLASCRNCQSLINGLDGLHVKGQTLFGGHIGIVRAAVDNRRYSLAPQVIKVEVSQQEATVSTGNSGPSVVAPQTKSESFLVFLRWVGGGWRVADVTKS